ncbi:hypothetical protein Ddc_19303 [Ditylenchus destructor]|nr:hypothetical protein Ddc_19303 [Ditylenchus destructor]
MGSKSESRFLVEVNHSTFWYLPNPHPALVAAKDEGQLEEIFNATNPKNFQNTSTGCSHGCNGWDDSELPEHKTEDEKETQTKPKQLKLPNFDNDTKIKARAIIQGKIISLVGNKAKVTWYKRPMKKRKPRISVDETLADSAGDALFTKLKEWNFDKNMKKKLKLKVQAWFTIFELVEDTRGAEKDLTNTERKYRFILKLY